MVFWYGIQFLLTLINVLLLISVESHFVWWLFVLTFCVCVCIIWVSRARALACMCLRVLVLMTQFHIDEKRTIFNADHLFFDHHIICNADFSFFCSARLFFLSVWFIVCHSRHVSRSLSVCTCVCVCVICICVWVIFHFYRWLFDGLFDNYKKKGYIHIELYMYMYIYHYRDFGSSDYSGHFISSV